MEPQRVAIPLFNDEVAPRFCFARRMLVAEVVDGATTQREQIDVADFGWRGRLALLSQRQVTVLLCGGFNRRYLHIAEALGIFVSWGHTGPVEPLLDKLCAGDFSLAAVPMAPDRGRGQGRGKGQGRGQGQGQGRGQGRGRGQGQGRGQSQGWGQSEEREPDRSDSQGQSERRGSDMPSGAGKRTGQNPSTE